MISDWKNKSESNLIAANKLNTESFFASSIHCSYYSCLQLMYHILKSHFEKTDSEINNESYQGAALHKGMHAWLINTIAKEIPGYNDGNQFNTTISDLQTLRIKSDYKNIFIDDQDANKAEKYASLTLQILKRNFKI